MTSGGTAGEIDDEAARWATRLDGRDLDLEPDAELAAWLAGDKRRAGALLRAQAALSLVDRARALPDQPAAPSPVSPSRLTRRGLLTVGAGGAVAAAAAGAFAVFTSRPDSYSTGLGEIRRVPLQDGSIAEINTSTALDVTLTRRLRRVRLQQGEAWFGVAKDAERPFVVEAADIRVRAVGTAFSVHRTSKGVEVMVTEGVVEAWRADSTGQRARMPAGSRMSVGADGLIRVLSGGPAIERDLAWRTGQIVLDGRTLEEAAAEFNRYNARQVVIEDAAIAREGLVGLFQTNEPDAFAKSVAAALGAHLTQTPTEIRIGAALS